MEWSRWRSPPTALARLGRDFAIATALVVILVPTLLVVRGADDWQWPITISVWLCTPLGMFAAGSALSKELHVSGWVHAAILFAGSLAGAWLGYLIAAALFDTPSLSVLFTDFLRNAGLAVLVIAAASIAGAVLWYRGEAFRLRSQAADVRHQVLQQQMQPHFLFNALGSLKELIHEDPARASDFTQRLADLYRLILASSESATAALGSELAIAESYLEIQRVRFGDRLKYTVAVPEALRTVRVPSLVIQTLVENAVKHGIAPAERGGEVCVRAVRDDAGGVEIEVANTGAPFAPKNGSGAGLANTRSRLELLYGARGALEISADPQVGTRARFRVIA